MISSAYGKSITASVLIHLLAFIVIAQWGMEKGRYDSNAHNEISVRLESGPEAEGKNSNVTVRKAEVKQRPVARETEYAVESKENALPVSPALHTEPQVLIESDERNEVAAKTSLTLKLPSYEMENKGEVSADPLITGGSEGEMTWKPVLIGRIKTAIQDAVSYPHMARKRGLEGTVLAGFSIDKVGLPRDIKVLKSSGHGILDREVERVIQKASPYPPVKGAIEVPVSFRLKE
jgi:TonB family protein